MEQNNFNVELLPQGVFILTLLDGKKIKGRFSMYALNRFCEKKELTYLQAIGKITIGMKISEYAELVLVALEDYYREDFEQCKSGGVRWTIDKVMDDILDPMGFGNEMMLKLFKHAVGRLGNILEEPAPDDKKKAGKQKGKQTTSH
jgi:hypothetical protein